MINQVLFHSLSVVNQEISENLLTQWHQGADVFPKKNIEKKQLCHHDKNYCYFCKSNIPVTNLIVGSRNVIKISKNMSLQKIR